MLSELIANFFTNCPRLVSDARDAVARHDGVEFQRATHVLRDHLALFSEQPLCDAVDSATLKGDVRSLEQAGEALAQLEEELERLRSILANLVREVIP